MNRTLIVSDEIADDIQSGKIKKYIVKSKNIFIECKYVFLKSSSGKDLGRSRVRRIASVEICHSGIFVNGEALTRKDANTLAIETGFKNFHDMLEELHVPNGECFIGKLIIWSEIRKKTR